jgi:uncharacterized repeat protein (TIGR03803 family)
MDPRLPRLARCVVIPAVSAFLIAPSMALAQSYQILHTFTINTGDGAQPFAGLIQATDGNFYGTTGNGGTNNWGTVFKMDPAGHVTILHSFVGTDGQLPKASLVQGSDGWLYGTTSSEGTLPTPGGQLGGGTVFKIKTDGTSFTSLHTFGTSDGNGGNDGAGPVAALVQGTDGDFYGTTAIGGAILGEGTAFKITSTGTFTRLHTFMGPEGRSPRAPLIQANDGSFYGTTSSGGTAGFNVAVKGTIFKMTSAGLVTPLHTFTFPNDLNSGANPEGPLMQASDGNFYGSTPTGGTGHSGFGGDGTVFRMDPAGNVTTLHSFNRTDGYVPLGGLIQGPDGLFYGTTSAGGSGGTNPVGTVFSMTAGGALRTLHTFVNALGSEYFPPAGVIRGTDGSLYGLTQEGGPGPIGTAWGVAFRLTLMSDLTVNFGAPYGVWVRAGSTWAPIHSLSPVSMVTGDLDGNGVDDEVINFGPGVGVWAWMNHSAWTFIHPYSPSAMATGDLNNDGHDDLIAVFPGFGTWRWNNGAWTLLHSLDATRLAIGHLDNVGNADLIVDFPVYGVWVLSNGTTWKSLHPFHPTTIVTADLDGNGRDDVVFNFPGYGIWVYYDSGTWAALHYLNASHIAAGHLDANAKADLVIDFTGGAGIWVYRNNATWTFLHGFPSESLLLADLDGNGKDELLVDFGPTYGLWQYANDSAWSQLHAISPAGIAAGRFF